MGYVKIQSNTEQTEFADAELITLGDASKGHTDKIEFTITEPMSRLIPGEYGDYRWVNGRASQGPIKIRAAKILLERLETADVRPGDKVKVHTYIQEPKKDGGRKYRTYDVWVDKGSDAGEFDPSPAEPKASPESTPVASDDLPPF